jgi:5-enolpyruvylshikimate-3-phosphate synthase
VQYGPQAGTQLDARNGLQHDDDRNAENDDLNAGSPEARPSAHSLRVSGGGVVLRGSFEPPGDKSIAHRAAMLAAICPGDSEVRNYPSGQDCISTLRCLKTLGVRVCYDNGGLLVISGRGLRGLAEPMDVLDAGNSGTTMRLLAGILAGQEGLFVLTGDESLRRRPMARVAVPLRAMGAWVDGRAGGTLAPLVIRGAGDAGLRALRHVLPVASAQVKSCVLLAGLYSDGETTVVEPAWSRDHTERLLRFAGVPVKRKQTPAGAGRSPVSAVRGSSDRHDGGGDGCSWASRNCTDRGVSGVDGGRVGCEAGKRGCTGDSFRHTRRGSGDALHAVAAWPCGDGDDQRDAWRSPGEVTVCGGHPPHPFELTVPGDPSSAAFILAAAAALPGSSVTALDVCANPTRLGFVQVLARMGASVHLEPLPCDGPEPRAHIRVEHGGPLTGVDIPPAAVPSMIDEVPIFAVLACAASTPSSISGIAELKVKETDRVAAVVEELSKMGARISQADDSLRIHPSRLRGARVSARGDHRMAMALAVAGLIASGTTVVEGWEATRVSYPGFLSALRALNAGDAISEESGEPAEGRTASQSAPIRY